MRIYQFRICRILIELNVLIVGPAPFALMFQRFNVSSSTCQVARKLDLTDMSDKKKHDKKKERRDKKKKHKSSESDSKNEANDSPTQGWILSLYFFKSELKTQRPQFEDASKTLVS